MATSYRVQSDLFEVGDFVRQVAVGNGKNLIIDALREYFKKDTLYTYRSDAFGFPLIPNLTDLPPDIQEERTSRIFIGDVFRYEKRFYPSISIKHSSGRYHPISFNQNHTTVRNRVDMVLDGYGNRSYVRVPVAHIATGAWDQSFEVVIASESIPEREELSDIVSGFFIGLIRQELYESGLFIKSVSLGAEREEEFANDKIFIQSITLDTYSEWRREIPINSADLVETINFCFNYNLFSDTEDDGVENSVVISVDDVV